MAEAIEQRILLCAPYGKDAELASQVLENAGLSCCICRTMPDVVRELDKGAAAVLTVEEALPEQASNIIRRYLARQPTWSDLPILVLTRPGGDSPWIKGAYERLGNLTLLERPVRASTLLSAARSALRARMRQYEVRSLDQRKDEFLAMLAHELRNPLAPISAAASLLELVSTDSSGVVKTSAIIARQVRHMSNLIDDLLDVARVTRGLIVYSKEQLDLRDILKEAVEQVSPLITARRHHLALHLPPDPTCVLGDRKRLIQVVANMLSNAAKYTPEGGSIVARLQVKPTEILLEISDNGIGMKPEIVSRVFDLFTQAERTSDRSQGGLGIGLALVKSLVESHGGTIHAHSEGPSKGSSFIVCLPRQESVPDLQDRQVGTATTEQETIAPLRILVVDDNVDAANLLKMVLDAMGHGVSVEYSAAGALERVRYVSPQVCLLDIGLPEMDGHELARRLRAMPETAEALLIAVSGYGQERDQEKSVLAGFDYHLVKPVDGMKLKSLLHQYTDS